MQTVVVTVTNPSEPRGGAVLLFLWGAPLRRPRLAGYSTPSKLSCAQSQLPVHHGDHACEFEPWLRAIFSQVLLPPW